MKRAAWILALGVALLLAGCGQKGALYLPDKNAQVITTPAASAPAPPAAPQSTPPQSNPATPIKPGDKQDDDSQTPK